GQRFLGIGADGIVLLGFLFVCLGILLVVFDHVLGELAVEVLAGEFRHPVVRCFLFAVRRIRGRHAQRIGRGFGLFVCVRMVLLQHLAERADAVAAAVLLG